MEKRAFLAAGSRRVVKAMKAVRSLWRNRDGSALIEASILTPMLFSLVLGVYEFSWYFYQQQLVEVGVRDAARYLARVPISNTTTNPCSLSDVNGSGTSFASYVANAQNIAATGQTASGGTARVKGWTAADVSIPCPLSSSRTGTYADGATTMWIVSVSTDFADPSLGLFGFLGLKKPKISASHQERFIGPG
jgi:Flp pilus assembly protein TadG